MERTDVINVSASMEHELQGQQYICTVTSKTNGKREFVYRVTKCPLFLSLTFHYFYIRDCAIIIRGLLGGMLGMVEV